jgi:hypothetical protein
VQTRGQRMAGRPLGRQALGEPVAHHGVRSVRWPGTSSTLTLPRRGSRTQRMIAPMSFDTTPAQRR